MKKKKEKTTYQKLAALFKEYRPQQAGLMVIYTAGILLNVLLLYRIQDIIDCVVEQKPVDELAMLFLKIFLLALVTLAVSIVENKSWHYFRNVLTNRMRVLLYQGMMKKNAAFFDTHATGDVASAVMNDGSIIAQNIGTNTLMFAINSVHVVVVIAVMASMNWIIGIVVAVVSVGYYLLMTYVNRKMREVFREQQQGLAEVNQSLTEKIKAAYDIMVMDKQTYFEKNLSIRLCMILCKR